MSQIENKMWDGFEGRKNMDQLLQIQLKFNLLWGVIKITLSSPSLSYFQVEQGVDHWLGPGCLARFTLIHYHSHN